MSRKNKSGRLEQEIGKEAITLSKPLKIGGEKYIIYCASNHHQGTITTEVKYLDCIRKGCDHLYIYKLKPRKTRI